MRLTVNLQLDSAHCCHNVQDLAQGVANCMACLDKADNSPCLMQHFQYHKYA